MGETGSRRGALVAGIAVGALVAGGILGGTGWGLASATAVEGLRIAEGVQPVTCEGADVGVFAIGLEPDEAGYRSPIVELRQGARCEIDINLVNDGWADAEIRSVILPGMAEGNGMGLTPHVVNPNGMERLPDEGSAAVVRIDHLTAPAGATTTLTAVVDVDGSPLLEEGGAVGLRAASVVVSVMGRDWTIAAAPESTVFFAPAP